MADFPDELVTETAKALGTTNEVGLRSLMTGVIEGLREALAKQLEEDIRPLLCESTHKGGYDCCGCGTYDDILDHAIRIVKGET
jgi:hypothetical protein